MGFHFTYIKEQWCFWKNFKWTDKIYIQSKLSVFWVYNLGIQQIAARINSLIWSGFLHWNILNYKQFITKCNENKHSEIKKIYIFWLTSFILFFVLRGDYIIYGFKLNTSLWMHECSFDLYKKVSENKIYPKSVLLLGDYIIKCTTLRVFLTSGSYIFNYNKNKKSSINFI